MGNKVADSEQKFEILRSIDKNEAGSVKPARAFDISQVRRLVEFVVRPIFMQNSAVEVDGPAPIGGGNRRVEEVVLSQSG